MKLLRAVLISLLPFVLSGCCGGVKILGLKQDGSTECPTGERVYLYRESKIGICLKEQVVVFTHCVSELSLGKTTSDSANKFDFELSGLKDILTSANLKPEFKTQVIREFANSNELDKARADAIRACMQLAGMKVG